MERTGDPAVDAPPVTTRVWSGSVSQPPLYLLADKPDPKDRYTVTAARAPFFINGPAQTQGANFSLHKGDAVTMLQRDFDYSRVRTGNGREGFVATDQLKSDVHLPADDAPALPPPPPTAEPPQLPPLEQMALPVEPPLPTEH